MKHDQIRNHCPKCGYQTLHERNSPQVNHLVHVSLTLACWGLWLPIWLLAILNSAMVRRGPHRCLDCGFAPRDYRRWGSLSGLGVLATVFWVSCLSFAASLISFPTERAVSSTDSPRKSVLESESSSLTQPTVANRENTAEAEDPPTEPIDSVTTKPEQEPQSEPSRAPDPDSTPESNPSSAPNPESETLQSKPSKIEEPMPQLRTWHDNTGGFSVEAEFVGIASGLVKLKKENGSKLQVPVIRLSEADLEFLRVLLKERGETVPF